MDEHRAYENVKCPNLSVFLWDFNFLHLLEVKCPDINGPLMLLVLNYKVGAFAKQCNNSMAARHFKMSEKQVRKWRRKRPELPLMTITKNAACGSMALLPAPRKN